MKNIEEDIFMLKDKYHLTVEQNKRLARSNLTRLVYVNSRFEGLTTTLPQTQTIIDGLGVDGVSIDDINIIVQLKRGGNILLILMRSSILISLKKLIKLLP